MLILPHLDEKEKGLYSRYDFDKPWDSPENLALAERDGQYTLYGDGKAGERIAEVLLD